MSAIPKSRILETLGPCVPQGQAEALFDLAIADAGLPARAAYTPSEVAVLGEAIMRRARELSGQIEAEATA